MVYNFEIHSPNQTYLPKIQYIHRNRTERMKMTCLKILVYLMTMMTTMMKVLTMNSLPLQEWPVLVRVVLQPGVHLQKCCQKVCELFVSNLMLVYVCCLRKTAKCWKIHLCEIILYFKFHIKWFYFVTSYCYSTSDSYSAKVCLATSRPLLKSFTYSSQLLKSEAWATQVTKGQLFYFQRCELACKFLAWKTWLTCLTFHVLRSWSLQSRIAWFQPKVKFQVLSTSEIICVQCIDLVSNVDKMVNKSYS